MLLHYIKLAWRNLSRNKGFTAINIIGLATGISAALLIFLIVQYEFSYDNFIKEGNRVYRVVLDASINGTDGHSAGVQAPLSEAIRKEMTGVALSVPVMSFQGDATVPVAIHRDNADSIQIKKQTGILFTNPDYFTMVGYTWLAGSSQSVRDPFTVVLTKERAAQYFAGMPAASVPGHKIKYNNSIIATVTGIVDALPGPSQFNAAEFISYSTIAKTNLQQDFLMDKWNDWMAYSRVYVKLNDGTPLATAEQQLNGLLNKYNKQSNPNAKITLRLQPLKDVHFNGNYQNFDQRIANKSVLYGLLAIGGFLLLLGCINFINLNTAQATKRSKEIGVRKTMGSSGWQLKFQFLTETMVTTFIAGMAALLLVPLFLSVLKDFLPPGLEIYSADKRMVLGILLALVVVVALLAGLYPSFVLSAFDPVKALKAQAGTKPGRSITRKTLTVAQFTIAQFFVIATIVVGRQISFSMESDLGFQKNAIIKVHLPRRSKNPDAQQLMRTLQPISGIDMMSTGFFAPADEGAAFTNIAYKNGQTDITPNAQIRWADPNYLPLYGIQLLAGRNTLPSDSIREFLVNETFAHEIGFPNAADAVNKMLRWNGKDVPIAGVIKDFHDMSTKAGISPLVLGGSNGTTLHIRLRQGNWPATLDAIKAAYNKQFPGEEFTYTFIDDMIANFYAAEQRTKALLQWATFFSILISCMGLFGLAVYSTNARTKEIGIRKILGATPARIVAILSASFLLPVGLAFLIASPLAWWAMHVWLQDYAYHIPIYWWIFPLCGLSMLMIAFTTLALQTIRAARQNPVKSLRNE
jgi:ABC-type antimicrobial peptide transport system permease subunit